MKPYIWKEETQTHYQSPLSSIKKSQCEDLNLKLIIDQINSDFN